MTNQERKQREIFGKYRYTQVESSYPMRCVLWLAQVVEKLGVEMLIPPVIPLMFGAGEDGVLSTAKC